MHSTKHYQKSRTFRKYPGFKKNVQMDQSESRNKYKSIPDKKFYGDTTLVKSITAISRIKEDIRDQHLMVYIQDREMAQAKKPGPEPERPDVQLIRDQMKILQPIVTINEFEEADDLDRYIEYISVSGVSGFLTEIPEFLTENKENLELMRTQGTDEMVALIRDNTLLLNDRVRAENKRRRRDHEQQMQHQKYLLEWKRDVEKDFDRAHSDWLRRDREYKEETEKLSKLFTKHLGANVKGLVKNELEKKDYFTLMEKIEEHYINFNAGNYTALFRTFLGTKLGRHQSVDSLGVYMDTLVEYLNRLKPEQPITDMLRLTTLENALESSDFTNAKLLDVVDMMKINATNGQSYTYSGLIQNLHLKETSQGFIKQKNPEGQKNRNYQKNQKSDPDDKDQINNIGGNNNNNNGPKKSCKYCLENGRKEIATTHNIDKCYLKQKHEREKSSGKAPAKKGNNLGHKKPGMNFHKALNQMEEIQEAMNNILKASKRKDIRLKGYSDDSDEDDEANMVIECRCHTGDNQSNAAILDSGCSSHMKRTMPNRVLRFESKVEQLKLPDASMIPSIGRADTQFEKDIMIVPKLHTDLHSTGAYDEMGCATIHIDGAAYVISKAGTDEYRHKLKSICFLKTIVTAIKRNNNLYYIRDQDQMNNVSNSYDRPQNIKNNVSDQKKSEKQKTETIEIQKTEISEISEDLEQYDRLEVLEQLINVEHLKKEKDLQIEDTLKDMRFNYRTQEELNNLSRNTNLHKVYVPLRTWDTSQEKTWFKSLGIPNGVEIWVECQYDAKNMIFPMLQEKYPTDLKYIKDHCREKIEAGMTILDKDILSRFPGIKQDLVGRAVSINQFEDTANNSVTTTMPNKEDRNMSEDFEKKGSLGTQLHLYNNTNKFRLLHERMAHQNIHTLYQSIVKRTIYGHNMSIEEAKEGYKNFGFCYACGMGKSTQFSRKTSETERIEYLPGEVWYTDCVAFSNPSTQGNFYWFPYLDRVSGIVKNYFGKLKTDVNQAHVSLIKEANLEQRRVKLIAGDDEKIYNHPDMLKYLERQLINWQSSAPYVHSQNRMERTIYTIQDASCTAMIANNVPEEYWQYAIEHITYEFNRTHSVQLKMTHFEKYYNIRPDVSNLVAFFSRGISVIPKDLRNKITHDEFQKRLKNARGVMCRVLGYATHMKNAFIILSNGTRSTTGNVLFDTQPSQHETLSDKDPNQYIGKRTRKYISNTPSILPATYTGIVQAYTKPYYQVVYNDINITEDYTIKELLKFIVPDDLAFAIVQHFDRSTPLPGGDEEYNVPYINFQNKLELINQISEELMEDASNQLVIPSRHRTVKQNWQIAIYNIISDQKDQKQKNRNARNTRKVKKTFKNKRAKQSKGNIDDYLQDENFKKAYRTEIDKVFGHGTLMLLKAKPKHFLKTRLVWDRIPRVYPLPDKYKCRWVACGYSQVPGRDYQETFSPTIKWRHLLICFHIMLFYNLQYNEIDIGTAYLNAEVDTELYIQLPPEMTREIPVYARLLKNLYGLKQGARNFFLLLMKIILGYGLKQSKIDPCVYIMNDPIMLVTTQVDNINVWFKVQKTYDDFLKYLRTQFKEVTESLIPKRIIGINMHYLNIQQKETYKSVEELLSERETSFSDVSGQKTKIPEISEITETTETETAEIQSDQKNWNCNTIIMEQFHYIEPIIADIDGEARIPIPSSINLNSYPKGDGVINLYEEMGTFRYLNDHTRPDFMTATTMMSSYMINPNEKHVQFTNKNMRQYIKHSKDEFKIIRKMEGDRHNMRLFAYCDGSYLQDYDCKSYIGFNFFLDTTSSSIFDKCVKDGTVSRSSTIVEIKAIDLCVLYTLTIRMFLEELGFKQIGPTTILTDSQPSLDILKNEQINDKVLYINVRIHFVREHQLLQEIIAKKVGTLINVADTMTKCLAEEGFNRHRQTLLYGHLELSRRFHQRLVKIINPKR